MSGPRDRHDRGTKAERGRALFERHIRLGTQLACERRTFFLACWAVMEHGAGPEDGLAWHMNEAYVAACTPPASVQ